MGKQTQKKKVKLRMTQLLAIILAALMVVGAIATIIVYLTLA
ncbi:MAG: hypothetical protein ACI3XS_06930 [Eubacteriales bacterium]